MKLKFMTFSAVLVASLASAAPIFAKDLPPAESTSLQKLEADNQVVVLAFHSKSCGTCKVQEPILETLIDEPEFANLNVFQVNFDNASDLRKSRRVNSSSTIVVLKGGQEIARSTGETDKEKLRQLLLQGLKA